MKLFKIACLALIAGTMTVGQTSCSSFTKQVKAPLSAVAAVPLSAQVWALSSAAAKARA